MPSPPSLGELHVPRSGGREKLPFATAEDALALMSCPSGWYPAGRTNKEEVLCCVDKQGCWRSACGEGSCLLLSRVGWQS